MTIEDETTVRAAAQRAIMSAVDADAFALLRTVECVRRERFATADGFLNRVFAVDRLRAAVVERERARSDAAFDPFAQPDADGTPVLDQPIRAHVLRPRC